MEKKSQEFTPLCQYVIFPLGKIDRKLRQKSDVNITIYFIGK